MDTDTIDRLAAELVAMGATPIPDAEIVDRGTYYEWTGFAPKATLWLENVAEAYYTYAGLNSAYGSDHIRNDIKLFFYPKATYEKPVRVIGMFTEGHTLLRYRVAPDGRQERLWTSLDHFQRPDRTRTRTELRPIHGAEFFQKISGLGQLDFSQSRTFLYNYTYFTQDRYTHLHRISGMFPPEDFGGPVAVAYYKGESVDPLRWNRLLQARAQLGELIGDDEADAEDAITAMENYEVFGSPARAIDAWNRLHPLESIQKCSCGHYERDDEVIDLREGRTACRACNDDGRVVAIEDSDYQSDLSDYAYQHEDGLWYSYPEDETPEMDGIRGYYSNVLDFLNPDTTIASSPYGDFLMGIELEVVPRSIRYAQRCVDDTKEDLCDDYAILKHDGSLDEGGFEIVTAPRGLAEHIERFKNWEPNPELRAWDVGCCGMHVHISSQAFTQATLGKFIEFINSEANDEFIKVIAGRHPKWDSQAADYAQREHEVVTGNPKKTCQYKSCSRYHMVNTTNLPIREADRLGVTYTDADRHIPTVELRIFRASLKKERLLAQIEFAHAAVMFCRWSSMRELTAQHFLKWLQGMAGLYPNLAKWYGVRANTTKIEDAPKARVGVDV